MTCIRCDKKIGLGKEYYESIPNMRMIKDRNTCKCVSPIKVDMNAVDHHMITEMTYLVQRSVSSTGGSYGGSLFSRPDFKLLMEYTKSKKLDNDGKLMEKDGILTTVPEKLESKKVDKPLIMKDMDNPKKLENNEEVLMGRTCYYGLNGEVVIGSPDFPD